MLAALAAEGLPLTILRDERVAYLQPEMVTPVVRRMLESGADFVFVLDADEFIRSPSRSVLERLLARVPAGFHALARWLGYVPDFRAVAGADCAALLRSAKRVPDARAVLHKVIVGRQLLATPAAFVGMGNHRVYPSDEAPDDRCPHARLPEEAVAIAHVPIRSAEQLTAKIAIGWLAAVAARRGNPDLSFHWREAYARLAAGKRFEIDDLIAMAANYSVPEAEWTPPDPQQWIAEPFLNTFALRYSDLGRIDPFAAVLRYAERIASG
jgi:hypothetical protein